MRLLLRRMHGSYTDAFLTGHHDYLFWRGGEEHRAAGPRPTVRRLDCAQLAADPPDVVIVQSMDEIDEFYSVLGIKPGRDIPAVFVEHNTPKGDVPDSRHPLAGERNWLVVHVTHFNDLFWDCAGTRTAVIELAAPEPAFAYSGELPRIACVINEPIRRWRTTGTDLLPRFAAAAPIDVFGIDADLVERRFPDDDIHFAGNLAPDELFERLACYRMYLHPFRWTSVGMSLIEAMHLGMPVLGLGTTETFRAVPAGAGALSTDIAELLRVAQLWLDDPGVAREVGAVGREWAKARFGLDRFHRQWDEVLHRAVHEFRAPAAALATSPRVAGGPRGSGSSRSVHGARAI